MKTRPIEQVRWDAQRFRDALPPKRLAELVALADKWPNGGNYTQTELDDMYYAGLIDELDHHQVSTGTGGTADGYRAAWLAANKDTRAPCGVCPKRRYEKRYDPAAGRTVVASELNDPCGCNR